jgi:hypothetical protein
MLSRFVQEKAKGDKRKKHPFAPVFLHLPKKIFFAIFFFPD